MLRDVDLLDLMMISLIVSMCVSNREAELRWFTGLTQILNLT